VPKVIGLTKLDTAQRMVGLLFGVLKIDELQFVNIFSANKVAILCSVDLIIFVKCFTETTQVTEGFKYFPWGLHSGQPCSIAFERQGNFTKDWGLGTGLVCVRGLKRKV
jgi:hypothetical protein